MKYVITFVVHVFTSLGVNFQSEELTTALEADSEEHAKKVFANNEMLMFARSFYIKNGDVLFHIGEAAANGIATVTSIISVAPASSDIGPFEDFLNGSV